MAKGLLGVVNRGNWLSRVLTVILTEIR